MVDIAYNVIKSPVELKPHPLNTDIYGEESPDQDLVSSIRNKGILEPLVIRADGTILSGHRRWMATKELALSKVPCRVIYFSDPLDEEEALIEFNRQREKTFTQKMRESDYLMKIERERAKERQIRKPESVVPTLAQQNIGEKARNIVAKKVGMSHGTFDKARTIWEKAKDGDEQAKNLLTEIDSGEKAIHTAFKEIKGEEGLKVSQKAITETAKQLYTSDSPEWYTPQHILDSVLELFGAIDLDPCSNGKGADANVPAKEHYTREDDGLSRAWHGKVYMNPPYGREVAQWVEKVSAEYQAGNISEAIVLIAARTDTRWFNLLVNNGGTWCAVEGRLLFSTPGMKTSNSAPFPSAIFYLGDNQQDFYHCFKHHGPIYRAIEEEEMMQYE
jgi:phage N-6-adenine-methyltransferase